MPASPIRALIFDLGRVLVGIDTSMGLYRYLSPTLQDLVADATYVDYCRGQVSVERFFQYVNTKIAQPLSRPDFEHLWCEAFVPMPGMQPLFEDLSDRYRIGLLSDTDPVHWRFLLDAFPFLQKIQKPTLSFEVGQLKPHPDCYRRAAQDVACQPGECLFIDDLQRNVIGAKQAGMQAIHFKGVENLRVKLLSLGLIEQAG